jgi:hypothetical protein
MLQRERQGRVVSDNSELVDAGFVKISPYSCQHVPSRGSTQRQQQDEGGQGRGHLGLTGKTVEQSRLEKQAGRKELFVPLRMAPI